jgi:hypothetical protein
MEGWQGFRYAAVVHRIAVHLAAKPYQADVLGNMRDDYVSELAIEALLASRKYQERYGGGNGESRYVHKSLWNYARSQKRFRFRRRHFWFQTFESELDPVSPVSLEDQTEARDLLAVIQKKLDKRSWGLLASVAEADGDLSAAWEADPSCNRWYFNAKVQRAREAGRKVIQN